MTSDDNDSKWGTIFLDSTRESTLSKLDAMQAASRQEQWNQRTQQDYLEKVRSKAVERARTILGEAYTERQKIIEEAEADAANIRQEAKAIQASAEAIRNEAQELKHGVQAELDRAKHTHSSAQEDGFQAGLEQAQEELEKFRHTMGSSVAGVLKAIEKQSLNIFAHWRKELVSLLKVCVEKGTALALDERYNKILEQLVIEAVRNLDDRRHVNLRVHPDDEPVMADIFLAAKEKMPDLGQWSITPDSSLELGGLVAESNSGTVDSRLELFREMIENILEHLALPESSLDVAGAAFVKEISRLEMENIAHMVPAEALLQNEDNAEDIVDNLEAVATPDDAGAVDTLDDQVMDSAITAENNMDQISNNEAELQDDVLSAQPNSQITNLPNNQDITQDIADHAPPLSSEQLSNPIDELLDVAEDSLLIEEMPQDLAQPVQEEIIEDELVNASSHEPSRQELEEELLPLPEDTDNTSHSNEDPKPVKVEFGVSEPKENA